MSTLIATYYADMVALTNQMMSENHEGETNGDK